MASNSRQTFRPPSGLLHSAGRDGDDLPGMITNLVVSSADPLTRRLVEKEAAVFGARGRAAGLRGCLRDQGAGTVRAAREALVTRARLRGAQRAILAAETKATAGTVCPERDRLAAQRTRDAARKTAAEAQLRVEVLNDPLGAARALRQRHAALATLVAQLAAELAALEQQHRALELSSANTKRKSEAIARRAPAAVALAPQQQEHRTAQLEARWAHLAGQLDRVTSEQIEVPLTTLGSSPVSTRTLLVDTEERYNTFHQSYLNIQEVRSLLKIDL